MIHPKFKIRMYLCYSKETKLAWTNSKNNALYFPTKVIADIFAYRQGGEVYLSD